MSDLVRSRQERTRQLVAVRRVDSDFYPFGGGLNLIDSPLVVEPGQCQNALNYEIGFQGGYKRVGGYEKINGLPPSQSGAFYEMLPFRARRKPVFWTSRGLEVVGAAAAFPEHGLTPGAERQHFVERA